MFTIFISGPSAAIPFEFCNARKQQAKLSLSLGWIADRSASQQTI